MKYLITILVAGGIYYYVNHFTGPSANILAVNDGNFQSVVLENKKPVLLFFYWNKNTSDYDHVRRAMSKLSELMKIPSQISPAFRRKSVHRSDTNQSTIPRQISPPCFGWYSA